MIDLFTASQDTDYNSRVNAGSGWIIYSFPHVVTPDDATVATTDTTPTVTGSVVATNSISTISAVEYRVDSNSVLGSWSSCTATDGAFDETSETYTCTLPTQTEGSHTIYFRATDTHTVYTAQSNYGEVALTIDLSGPTYSNVQTAKTDTAVTITYTTNESASTQLEWGTTTSYGTTTSETDISPRVTSHSVALSGLTKCTTYHFRLLGSDSLGHAGESADFSFRTTGCDSTPSTDTGPGTAQIESDGDGGVFAPSNGSYTGGQFITAIVEAGTLPFDAYLYALLSFPSNANGSLINPLTGVVPSGGLLTNVVNAGGVLGIRQACGINWQVAGIQQIWYKTYPSTIIIPEIQLKPSIIALGYTEADLIPLGRPGTRFDPLRLKLAYSPDGMTWRILPTSVVDTTNRTVAALHKIGGYYMIVAGCQTGYRYGYGVGTGSKGGIGGSTLMEEIEDDKLTVAPKLGSDNTEEVEEQPAAEQVDEITSEEPNLFQRILNFFGGLF